MRVIVALFFILVGTAQISAQETNSSYCPIHNQLLITELVKNEDIDENGEGSLFCKMYFALDPADQKKLAPYAYNYIYESALKKYIIEPFFEISYCAQCTDAEARHLIIGGEFKEFINPQKFFKIRVPHEIDIKFEYEGDHKLETSNFVYHFTGFFSRYSIEINEYPQPYFNLDDVTAILMPVVNTSFNGYPAAELTKISDHNIIKTRRFLVDNRLVTLRVEMALPTDYQDNGLPQYMEEAINQFFNSFQLISE